MRIGLLRDAIQSFFRRPATEKYPYARRAAPARLRGALHFDPARCTGCGMCVRDCPANAIELITLDKKNKRFVLRYHVDRCTFCAQCVETCSFGCLKMSNEQWELAAQHHEPFTVYYGNESDVTSFLAQLARAKTDVVPTK
jgi:formate hydrogenlyase subunit 6/NADH:ubiquinone oxidoreductase subunit I